MQKNESANKSKQLLNCPFCGGEATMTHYNNKFAKWYQVVCMNCHLSQTSTYLSEEVAITAWNTRKPMERIVERLEKDGGCDAQDEWSKGWDEAMTRAIQIVKEEM